jgi:DNA-binding IclR family transcriptional regulator
MAAKTYTPVASNDKFIDIIEYVLQQNGPATGSDIANGLDMPHGTVMSHIQSAVNRKWLRVVNGCLYEPGLRLMGLYSAYKVGLKARIDTLQSEYNVLEG